MVGSSSCRRRMPCAALSSSPLFLGSTAIERVGAGYSTPASFTRRPGEQSVSPVRTPCSFGTAPMSPAERHGASSCFLPRRNSVLPTRRVSPVRMSTSCESPRIFPDATRR